VRARSAWIGRGVALAALAVAWAWVAPAVAASGPLLPPSVVGPQYRRMAPGKGMATCAQFATVLRHDGGHCVEASYVLKDARSISSLSERPSEVSQIVMVFRSPSLVGAVYGDVVGAFAKGAQQVRAAGVARGERDLIYRRADGKTAHSTFGSLRLGSTVDLLVMAGLSTGAEERREAQLLRDQARRLAS
jgi:hypothetical protein